MQNYLDTTGMLQHGDLRTLLNLPGLDLFGMLNSLKAYSKLDGATTQDVAFQRELANLGMMDIAAITASDQEGGALNASVLGNQKSYVSSHPGSAAVKPGNQVSLAMNTPLRRADGVVKNVTVLSSPAPALDSSMQPEWSSYVDAQGKLVGLLRRGSYQAQPGWARFALQVVLATALVTAWLGFAARALPWVALRESAWSRIGWMALVLTFALIIWLDFAVFLYLIFYGVHMPDFREFFIEAVTTPSGLAFLALGNLLGAVIAFAVFSITVVSCPMLLDRDVDFVTAMLTSLRCVKENPWQMLGWAAMIALWFAVAMVTMLAALIVEAEPVNS